RLRDPNVHGSDRLFCSLLGRHHHRISCCSNRATRATAERGITDRGLNQAASSSTSCSENQDMSTAVPDQRTRGFNWPRFLLAEVIGWPAMLVILTALTGGWGNASLILLYSVVCTAGVGLGFWGTVAWAIGIVLLAAYDG